MPSVPSPDERLAATAPENALPELKDVLAKAMANAPRVVDAGLSADYSDVAVKAARAPMLPSVTANVNMGAVLERYEYGATAGREPYTVNRTVTALFYNAGVYQPLYRWGALKKGYQSAQLTRAISRRNLEETRRALAVDVRRAYFDLIITSNTRDYQRMTLANLERDLEAMKLRQQDGFATSGEVESLVRSVDAYKQVMEKTEVQFQSQWRAFRQLAGLDPAAEWALPQEIPPLPKEMGEQLATLPAELGSHVPNSVLNAEDYYQAERLNYEIQKVRQRPQLNVSASVSQENRSPDNNALGQKQLVTSYGGYLNVSWNIFDGFATQAAKQSALIQARRRKNERDQAEYNAREALRAYVNNLNTDWKALQTAERTLSETRAGVDASQKDFESGFVQRSVWDAAKLSAQSVLISTNSVRASFHLQLLNYLSLRGQDPALGLLPTAAK